jgi:hypothetical protein
MVFVRANGVSEKTFLWILAVDLDDKECRITKILDNTERRILGLIRASQGEPTMYKCITITFFGPCGGEGGYGSITQIGMDRCSPKRAVWKASHWSVSDGKATRNYVNQQPWGAGGGVPILRHFQLIKDNKVIKEVWD